MAAIGASYLNWAEIRRRSDPDGTMADVVELLSKDSPILQDAVAVECNGGLIHQTTWRHSLPPASWGVLNRGTPLSKSGTTQLVDTVASIQREAAVDTRTLARAAAMGQNASQVRLDEAKAEFESMGQQLSTTLFYGNMNTDPEGFHGLAPRYGTISGNPFARQVIDGGGTGADNGSIFIVGWGPQTVHLIHPKSMSMAIEHVDQGKSKVEDSTGVYWAMHDSYSQQVGLCVRHPQSVVRICNIDISDLTYNAATGANLMRLLGRGIYRTRHKSIGVAKWVAYMPPTIHEYLAHQAREANSNTLLSFEETKMFGEVLKYGKLKLALDEGLVENETRVV